MGVRNMRLLKLAVKNQRWDLVAHTIVFATAMILNKGDKLDANKSGQKNKYLKGQSKSQ